MNNRFNPIPNRDFRRRHFDKFRDVDSVYALATYQSGNLTMCHPDVHKDVLCSVVNAKSFARYHENLVALWAYIRSNIESGAVFYERMLVLLRIWLFTSFGKDIYAVIDVFKDQ